MSLAPQPLKHLIPGWYAVVMGLTGLSLAWHRAVPLMGEVALGISVVVGVLGALVFGVLAVATVQRGHRHPEAWADDRRHPVHHTFIATLPIAIILLATVWVALAGSGLGPSTDTGPARWAVQALWWTGAMAQLLVTVRVLGRWFRGNTSGGLQWASATPALFLPIVGNVLVPLAGVPLGHVEWSAAQFGIGLMFWPVVMGLIVARIAVQGLWPERLLPAAFIFIAPPAAVGLSAMQFGAPNLVVWALWGMGLFTLLWAGTLGKRIAALPFGLAHWGMSFPLASLAALTLRLATPGSAMAVLAPALLALTTLVIMALVLGTVQGLRNGSLLAPEPVAMLVPAAR